MASPALAAFISVDLGVRKALCNLIPTRTRLPGQRVTTGAYQASEVLVGVPWSDYDFERTRPGAPS